MTLDYYYLILKTRQTTDDIEYCYKIVDGVAAEEHYGIQLAKKVGLDNEIIDCALQVSKRIKEIFEDLARVDAESVDVRKSRIVEQVKYALSPVIMISIRKSLTKLDLIQNCLLKNCVFMNKKSRYKWKNL